MSSVFGFSLWNNARSKEVCANSISCIKDLSGKFNEEEKEGEFLGKKITLSSNLIAEAKKGKEEQVLGQSNAYKRIQIDLTNQRLYAFEGDNQIFEFPISSGKWYPTPTGTFKIWVKLRYTKMEGGNPGTSTYYYLPNVPYVMFYYNDEVSKARGFSLHGTYWHNNFGHPMSHGCVNMRIEDVEKLYAWADPPTLGNMTYASAENLGTRVIIYGQAPLE